MVSVSSNAVGSRPELIELSHADGSVTRCTRPDQCQVIERGPSEAAVVLVSESGPSWHNCRPGLHQIWVPGGMVELDGATALVVGRAPEPTLVVPEAGLVVVRSHKGQRHEVPVGLIGRMTADGCTVIDGPLPGGLVDPVWIRANRERDRSVPERPPLPPPRPTPEPTQAQPAPEPVAAVPVPEPPEPTPEPAPAALEPDQVPEPAASAPDPVPTAAPPKRQARRRRLGALVLVLVGAGAGALSAVTWALTPSSTRRAEPPSRAATATGAAPSITPTAVSPPAPPSTAAAPQTAQSTTAPPATTPPPAWVEPTVVTTGCSRTGNTLGMTGTVSGTTGTSNVVVTGQFLDSAGDIVAYQNVAVTVTAGQTVPWSVSTDSAYAADVASCHQVHQASPA